MTARTLAGGFHRWTDAEGVRWVRRSSWVADYKWMERLAPDFCFEKGGSHE